MSLHCSSIFDVYSIAGSLLSLVFKQHLANWAQEQCVCTVSMPMTNDSIYSLLESVPTPAGKKLAYFVHHPTAAEWGIVLFNSYCPKWFY